ncbi:AEC family transporter [Acinetobacter sp. ANC 4648]|uniref:AEC family transporter n=1 Tax=Acinetobacter sp. ANC 4648 TaxID=1977875 RepID=UPI000A32FD3F|nr:permease [Acinetobacter sp. ANC 4648]OTG84010.1 permease [Acinetobacter sp. ANC 4648]
MALLFPLLSFICGLILASSTLSTQLKSLLSSALARLFIPIVIIYNMVFYREGSLSLMLFSFFAAFLMFFAFLAISKDRLASLCFSYTNMAWLGFPIAIALFGSEISSAMIALYIGISIFGNTWAVTSVSSEAQSFKEIIKKVMQSPPVIALFIALIFRGLDFQSLHNHQWIDRIYSIAKWGMSFAGMCVLGMWLRNTRVDRYDLLQSFKVAGLKLLCGVILCGLAYQFLPIPYIHEYIGVMFLLFCLPPAANIVALETHYQGTGISAKYIASGTIVSCGICFLYGLILYLI